ncbi:MAG: beta-ketoacyl-ACP synthase [Oligoflexales bacterium]
MMNSRRVVITGVGLLTPLGHSLGELWESLTAGRSGIQAMPGWSDVGLGLKTGVAAPVSNFDERSFERKKRRSMSRVSLLATQATAQAIEDARLAEDVIGNQRTGISYGSSMGGTSAIEEYYRGVVETKSLIQGVYSTTFLKIMSHTCAANIAVTFGIPGRVIASCTACAASTQAIGFGWEAIKNGYADTMICGGAEELTPAVAAVFDALSATSQGYNSRPQQTPRPFCKNRDGMVVGEGAGTIILESLEHAKKRGAKIYGEIKGFFTNNDAVHMTNPSTQGLRSCMEGALEAAGLRPGDIDYVNAHATGTENGDVAESLAVESLFGSSTPISSSKGNYGHLLGAAGVVETATCIKMLETSTVLPTLNQDTIDPQCGKVDFVMGKTRNKALKNIMKNSFALGGINATLILSKVD